MGRGRNEDTAVLRSCSERDISVQRYEFFANNCAMARPMPRLPPVTRICRGLAAMAGFSQWVFCYGLSKAFIVSGVSPNFSRLDWDELILKS